MLFKFRKLTNLLLILVFAEFFTIQSVFGARSIPAEQATTELTVIEQALVKDARKNINKKLGNKKGALERISCNYKVFNGKPQSVLITTLYAGYRKKTESEERTFSTNFSNTPDEIIKIIFKATDDKLTIVCKNKKHHRRCKYASVS
jgi:hypothetical protein